MTAIKAQFKSVYSEATFEGVIEPLGASGYKFSGSLESACGLDRRSCDFANTVRLGHGGTSGDYTYLNFKLENSKKNTFLVEGEGTRIPNETVDFRLGFNEGLSGEFKDGGKITVTAGGPWQVIEPVYTVADNNGHAAYHIYFDGKARAEGPTGFIIEGTLTAFFKDSTLTTQYARFGYKNSSGSWSYQGFGGADSKKDFKIFGTRKAGEKIQVMVGATSQIFNLYDYGAEVNCELPELF